MAGYVTQGKGENSKAMGCMILEHSLSVARVYIRLCLDLYRHTWFGYQYYGTRFPW